MSRPFVLAPIKKRYLITAEGSTKQTYHIVLDLNQSDIDYKVGDCVAISPQNTEEHVHVVLQALQACGSETINDQRQKESVSLLEFLTQRADLFRIKRKLLELIGCAGATQADLISLLKAQGPLQVDLQLFCDHLYPLLPRFYSIASSMQEVGKEVHLTVGMTGLCTQFLCKRAEVNQPVISLYHHPSKNFTLSESSFSKPIIMVGPGTGIAPFIGFLQERIKKGAQNNWLFFGERSKEHDFYYQEYLESLVRKGQLILDTAFSRDQEHKIYVQDRMVEKSAELWQWLQEGAYFYVCGDASRMAKAVDQTLHSIVAKEGKLDPVATKTYIRDLKLQSRYLRDVY